MRASRLVAILLLLQARGRLTANQLATELEVSVRTIYRDVDSLHAAGIPLYGDAGHRGGYQLLDGYRTRLTGLSAGEARALTLAGLPGPAAELGLGSVLAAAQLKVRAALPHALADQVGQVQARFHLDVSGWYATTDEVPFLPAVADAVWLGRALQVRYRRWQAPTDVDRRLEPYGLVLKAGRWYLVAGPRPRTYRVDQILDLAELADEFTIPEAFSLAGYWQAYTTEFLGQLHRADATVRLTPAAIARLSGPAAEAVTRTGITEPGGWTRAVLPIESADRACREYLALGPEIEVLEPLALRDQVAAAARATAGLYSYLQLGSNVGRHGLQRLLMIASAEGGVDDGEGRVPLLRDDRVRAAIGLIADGRHGRQMVLGHDVPQSGDIGTQAGRGRGRDRQHHGETRKRAECAGRTRPERRLPAEGDGVAGRLTDLGLGQQPASRRGRSRPGARRGSRAAAAGAGGFRARREQQHARRARHGHQQPGAVT